MVPSVTRVLIVEPDREVRTLIEQTVQRLGHEAILHDAARGAPTAEVDVLLVEPAAPRERAFAHALRQLVPELATVICSVRGKDAELESLRPVRHVVKPFSRSELEQALHAAAGLTARARAGAGV